MVAKLINTKIGRNEQCPCGSELKYKHCCGKEEPKPKQMTQMGLMKILQKLVKDNKGYSISCEDLESIPKDEILVCQHDPVKDVFKFAVAKVKKSPIIQLDKRIIV